MEKNVMKKNIMVVIFLIFTLFDVISQEIDTEPNESMVPVSLNENIVISEYYPFSEDSKIFKLDTVATLKLIDNLPRLDGATALYPVYSAFVQAVYPYGSSEWWSEYSESDATVKDENGTNIRMVSTVKCTGTKTAYQNLLDGYADIIFCAQPSEEQIAEAENKGLEYHLYPIGIEAFVIFVNNNNPIENITIQQFKDIYSGSITNWNELTGNDETILAYQRDKGSGSQTIFEKIVMQDTPIMKPEYINTGMGSYVKEFENYTNAIGYSFHYFTTEMVNNSEIKLLSVNGIEPTYENIKSGEYPLSGNFYAITLGNESENTKNFINWILSEQGQYIIEKTGYIKL
jgi:phosphate transport system substrate-binding protein